MTTNRLPRNAGNPFIVIATAVMRNPNLRAIEKVILTNLIGLPDGWQPCAKALAKLIGEGVAAVQRAIAGLIKKGYLVCHSIRDKKGRFLEWAWTINEASNPPSEDSNFDIYGHVVTFDRPESASANLRAAAKNKRKQAQEPRAKSKAETSTVSDFCPDMDFPELDNSGGSNIDIRSNDPKEFERESVCVNNEELQSEENPEQAEVFPLEVDKEEEEKQVEIFHNLSTKTESEASAETRDWIKGSATAEVAPEVEVGYFNEEVASKVELAYFDEEVANYDQAELLEFKAQLEELGKQLGKRNPVAWAYTIIKNLGKTPCTYWEDFKAGRALGASEQQEWEIAPGVPCQVAVQCLEQDYLGKQGATPTEASMKAARTIANPSVMKQIWETMKNRVLYQKRKFDEQKAMGIENPATLDPWMTPRAKANMQDVSIALTEMQAALPAVLQPARYEVEQVLLPEPPVEEEDSDFDWPTVEPKVETEVDKSSEPVVEAGDRTIPVQIKAQIAKTLNKFSNRQTKKKAILEANLIELSAELGVSVAELPISQKQPEPASSSEGGTATYLANLEIAATDVW